MKDDIHIILEKYITVIISSVITIVSGIVFLKLNMTDFKMEKVDLIFSSVISVITTIIGFLLTGLTIIMSLMQTRIMRIIRKNSGEKLLSKYIISPIIWGIISIIYILIVGFNLNSENNVKRLNILVLIFEISMFIVGTIRINYFMKEMFLKISEEYKIKDEKNITRKAKENSVKFVNK